MAYCNIVSSMECGQHIVRITAIGRGLWCYPGLIDYIAITAADPLHRQHQEIHGIIYLLSIHGAFKAPYVCGTHVFHWRTVDYVFDVVPGGRCMHAPAADIVKITLRM